MCRAAESIGRLFTIGRLFFYTEFRELSPGELQERVSGRKKPRIRILKKKRTQNPSYPSYSCPKRGSYRNFNELRYAENEDCKAVQCTILKDPWAWMGTWFHI